MKYPDYLPSDGPQSRVEGGRKIYCKGGGGGGGDSTTVQEIPAELKPLASAYTKKAIGLSDQPFSPYTGQRFEALNPTQYAGIGAIQNRALYGDPTMANAEANLNQVIGGQQNPYLDQAVNSALGQVQGRVNSQFSGANFGNTAHQETLARVLGDQANNMYANAYDADQARRLQAISQAPTFGNQAYTDASQLLSAGQVMQDQGQQARDFAYQQYQEGQDLPYKQLAAMSGVFGSNLGGVSRTTSSGGGGGK